VKGKTYFKGKVKGRRRRGIRRRGSEKEVDEGGGGE
jgi:hypothetical protein